LSYLLWKRLIDMTLAFVAMTILLPLFIIIAIAIKLDSEGPVLFKQLRAGRNKKLFYMYKFRTMSIYTPNDRPTHLLINPEQYITKLGKLLRKTSLDELPQIWNVFRGHMALIGPRPAIWNQYDLIKLRDQNGANTIRPGLTGWAQINGRDELTTKEKTDYDGEYTKRIGPVIDFKCFFITIKIVYRQAGIMEGANEYLVNKEAAAAKEQVSIETMKTSEVI